MGVRMTRVLGIGGTTRQDSSSERALRIAAAAAAEAGATVELITAQALLLPIYDPENPVRSDPAAALVAALRDADAVLISSPGYHGTVSGMVKNALDYVEDLRDDDRPYLAGLPIGCIAVAYGWQASVATLHTLRTCAHALRGWPTPLGAALNASVPGLFDQATGACTDGPSRFQLETVGRQVVEFAATRMGGERALDPAQL
ncbi:NADPH-dependent FMN reductase [Nonomuraea sp. NPDC050153]|uniref:NADPH-dependent FMN reductase n=1 Tax=Nonomuraea sp. NPDC050153 TaxID=3364359 RepID=UPI00379D0A0D